MKHIPYITTLAGLLFSSLLHAGEFGDHCTTGLSKGSMVKTKCEINQLYQGKTYCFGSAAAKEAFLLAPDEIISKAATFYAKNAEPEREKISQTDAIKQIESKQCDLSNKDAGYLIFNGLDLRHCNMKNVSFFGAELKGANLSGADLSGAYLNLARLENANFSGATQQLPLIFKPFLAKPTSAKPI